MIMVDTSVWIDYFKGIDAPHCARLDGLLGSEPIGIGDLMITEVLQGFASDRNFEQARDRLIALIVVDLGGREIAIDAARNFRKLRSRGITVRKTIDTIIATRCITDGYPLLHHDRDFAPFFEHLGLKSVM